VTPDQVSLGGDWTEDPRYRVSARESVVTAAYFGVYIVLTIGTAWLLGGGKQADEIDLVLGFPAWFFWSTFALGGLFCVVPYLLVRHYFTDMSLEPEDDTPDDASGGARRSGVGTT
jgi:uncharacterized membrane protein YhdT